MSKAWRVDYWGKWTRILVPIRGVRYSVEKRPDGPAALKVEYRAARQWWAELIDFTGPAEVRVDAARWWQERSAAPVPATAEEAVALANAGAIARPTYAHIIWAHDDPTPQLGGADVGRIPDWPPAAPVTASA